MYAGQLVEVAPRHELFSQPRHPYTHGLIASVPQLSSPLRKPGLLLKGLLRRDAHLRHVANLRWSAVIRNIKN